MAKLKPPSVFGKFYLKSNEPVSKQKGTLSNFKDKFNKQNQESHQTIYD